jgi:transcriptional regulator with XRE-family HTH domain
MSEITKNPLNVCFGYFLKKHRKDFNKTTNEVALEMGLGHSLYRMVEAGNSTFPSGKTFALIKTFSETFINQKLEFELIAKYILGAHYIDTEMLNAKKEERTISFNDLKRDLIDNDIVFSKFFSKVYDFFSKRELPNSDYYTSELIPKEVLDFLTNKNYELKPVEQYNDEIFKEIKSSYSLHIEMILSLIREFKSHPPLHISGIADKWEKDNKTKFTHLKGFYLKEDIIIKDLNFKLFNYDYLFENTFEELKMIFVTDISKAQLEEEFVKELNISRMDNNLKELTKTEIKKIKFKSIEEKNLSEDFHILIRENKGLDTKDLLAYWSFSMISGNQNGFVGYRNRTNERDYVLNLKYGDAKNRLRTFDDLWKTID